MLGTRIALFLLAFLAVSDARAEVYYVDVPGLASNTGLSQASPWSIKHAFSTASAGDTVYVKAGDYGEEFLVVGNSGVVGSVISFIGYKDTPGDIVSDGGATVAYGTPLDPQAMPYLENVRVNSEGSGTAITTNSNDYLLIENFQIRYYKRGVLAVGGHTTVRNVISDEAGDHNPAHSYPGATSNAFLNYSGHGIAVEGDGSVVENCTVINAGAEGIGARNGSGILLIGNAVYADQNVNPTDYYLLVAQGVVDSEVRNTTIKRIGNLEHGGHGVCLKGNNNITGNLIDGFEVVNTSVEIQFPLVSNNIVRNGTITAGPNGDEDRTALVLANGSHHNTYENIVIDGGNVSFRDWDDGLSGDVQDSADDNVFRNIVVKNNLSGIAFHYYHVNNHMNGADNNVFENCLFTNLDYLFEIDRANSNTQLTNAVIHDVGAYSVKRYAASPSYPLDIVYSHTNFSDVGFAAPSGTNITQYAPDFVDVANEDFHLMEGSALVDIGTVTGAGTDMDGVPRPQGTAFDLGPFEYVNPAVAGLLIQEQDTGFCSVDGAVESDNAGFTGTGYANSDNVVDVAVSWSVQATTSGPRDVTFRFANASTNPRDGELTVNGMPTGIVVSLPPTGAWTDWTLSAPVSVNLESGQNLLSLVATTQEGLGNIDYILFGDADLIASSDCTAPPTADPEPDAMPDVMPDIAPDASTGDVADVADVADSDETTNSDLGPSDVPMPDIAPDASTGDVADGAETANSDLGPSDVPMTDVAPDASTGDLADVADSDETTNSDLGPSDVPVTDNGGVADVGGDVASSPDTQVSPPSEPTACASSSPQSGWWWWFCILALLVRRRVFQSAVL